MGSRGPAPKPTILKLAAGNPGKRPINTAEPVPPRGAPERPAWVDGDAAAVWDQLVPRLATVGLATTIDGNALGRYCVLFSQWLRAKAALKGSSTYPIKSANGKRVVAVREFPQAAELRKLSQLLLQIEREFGLTPASRTRIRLDNEKSAGADVNEFKRRFFARGPA